MLRENSVPERKYKAAKATSRSANQSHQPGTAGPVRVRKIGQKRSQAVRQEAYTPTELREITGTGFEAGEARPGFSPFRTFYETQRSLAIRVSGANRPPRQPTVTRERKVG